MLKVHISRAPTGSTVSYSYHDDALRVDVHEEKSTCSKEDIMLLERECSKFSATLPDGVICLISITVSSRLNNVSIRVEKEKGNVYLVLSENYPIDVAPSFADLLADVFRLAEKVLRKLEDTEKHLGLEPPKEVSAKETAEIEKVDDTFPSAAMCFDYLAQWGIKGDDAAGVICMSASRVLGHIPITDDDYKIIYEDLRRPFFWGLAASLVNFLCERAGIPLPTTNEEFAKLFTILRRKLLKVFPPFANYPKTLTQWPYAFYYFIYNKISCGEITLGKEEVEYVKEESA